jgi:general stress protein 26
LLSDSKHYSWTDAIAAYIEDDKDKPKYVIINVDQDIKEVAKQLRKIIK